jgi:hypothetical protein
MFPFRLVLGLTGVLLLSSIPAHAQIGRPAPAIELTIGHAAFIDEDPIDHLVLSGGYRHYVGPRLSLGPEIQYMIGPGKDRDFFATGNVWFDVMGPDPRRRVTPYLVAGGGIMLHYPEFDFLGGPYKEGAATGGIGFRVAISDRWYVAPEARLGWEAHARVTATVGYRPGIARRARTVTPRRSTRTSSSRRSAFLNRGGSTTLIV